MPNTTNPKERPGLLTVIGILSFIGLGYRILSGLLNASVGTITSSLVPFLNDTFENEADLSEVPDSIRNIVQDIFDSLTKFLDNITGIYLTIVLLSLIGLAGVIMMWQLKKTGFYIYTIARIFILLVPVIFIGYNIISMIWLSFGVIFAAIFIVLYSLNLKHMH